MIRVITNFFLPFIFFSTLTRLVLFGFARLNGELELDVVSFNRVFIFGGLNDLATFIYIASALALIYFITYPLKRFKNFNFIFKNFIYFSWIFALCFNLIAELFFWEEFGCRFNFIAVDYLVYTREVVGNIRESYNLAIILPAIFVVALIVFMASFKYYQTSKVIINDSFNALFLQLLVYFFACGFIHYLYSPNLIRVSENRYLNELSKNGLYELFSAFFNNRLNYDEFYLTLPTDEAFKRLKTIIKTEDQDYLTASLTNISRWIGTTGKIKPYNVIILSVESLSADYLRYFGGPEGITPNLDRLAGESLFFTNYYATGTRTVRGLEAMTLSVPPTPGNSIIRRPQNKNLFSINSVLEKHNYESKFIYGGYGYFDNMNNFFSNNNFQIVDRSTIDSKNISFANIWGICDEDLYNETIRQADLSYAKNKPFFNLVMTTSNHRPYSFPAGKILTGENMNRKHAVVKYTDYAINHFLEEAKKKPWFKNTIFIITADHCASSASKSDIAIGRYHIPLIIYFPGKLQPKIYHQLASQMDLAPTILSLLNIPYVSKFFGNDIIYHSRNRALMATYQKLAYLQGGKLIILSPDKSAGLYQTNEKDQITLIPMETGLLETAISYYQTADYLYSNGLMTVK